MWMVAASREAAAAPTKAAVRRAAPREAAGKIRQPDGGRFFLRALGFCVRGLILNLGYYSYRLT
jgi:hypothetical protein